jgi:hypothetical protein
VCALLTSAGFNSVAAVAESGVQPVNSPDDWWAMIMGSGYRGTVAQLDPAELERVRLANLSFITGTSLRSLESNVVYATAEKTSHKRHQTIAGKRASQPTGNILLLCLFVA